jgi:hypothetical protein
MLPGHGYYLDNASSGLSSLRIPYPSSRVQGKGVVTTFHEAEPEATLVGQVTSHDENGTPLHRVLLTQQEGASADLDSMDVTVPQGIGRPGGLYAFVESQPLLTDTRPSGTRGQLYELALTARRTPMRLTFEAMDRPIQILEANALLPRTLDPYTQYTTDLMHEWAGYVIEGEVDLIERLGEGASTNVIVYPNPTRGYLQARIVHAEGGPLRVVLYDLQGRARLTLLEATAPEQFVTTLRKDINLPAGTYFIRLEANGVTHVKPITVVR